MQLYAGLTAELRKPQVITSVFYQTQVVTPAFIASLYA